MTRERRFLSAACACLLVGTVPATALAQPEASEAPESESESEPAEPEPAEPEPDSVPGGIATADGTRVHIVNTRPDEDVGVVKLARYHGSHAASAGNALIVTTKYEDLCAEPCGVPVDVSERPIFFLVRDGQPVSYGFRLPEAGEVTLKFKPPRSGLYAAGFVLTCFLILPAGIPMLVVGKSKVFIADGAPSNEQEFSKLKKAKL